MTRGLAGKVEKTSNTVDLHPTEASNITDCTVTLSYESGRILRQWRVPPRASPGDAGRPSDDRLRGADAQQPRRPL